MNKGERIKYLRKEILGLTQQEFAQKINISRGNCASIELGRVSLTERVKNDICQVWNINGDWIEIGGPDESIFNELTSEMEIALCASEILENADDEVIKTIIEFIKIYKKLDSSSKEVIKNFGKELIKNLK